MRGALAGATQPSMLYVDITDFSGTCNDNGPGTQAEPFCSLQEAADVVNPGQAVDILATSASVKPQSVTITRSGTPDAPITFTYAPGSSPFLSSTQAGSAVFTLKDVHDVTIDGLAILPGADDAIDVIGSSNITISHDSFSNLYSSPPAVVSVDGASSEVTISRNTFMSEAKTAVLAEPGASGVTVTTNTVQEMLGSGITLDGVANAVVASNTADSACGNGVVFADASSGVAENNVLNAGAGGSGCPTTGLAGLAVDTTSAGTVQAGYNAFFAKGTATYYSWAGTPYSAVAGFQAAVPGQGTNDVALPAVTNGAPGAGSPALDSADCAAPGELSADIYGNPRVADPQATDASLANGSCDADRGAIEVQDSLPVTFTQSPLVITKLLGTSIPAGMVPFAYRVTVTSAATSPWNEPVTYTVNWGDGRTSNTATPGVALEHTYYTAGQYTVTVMAADTGGSTSAQTAAAYALPASPVPATLSAAPVESGSAINTDQASFRTSLADPWGVQSVAIAFGDGSSAGPGDLATGESDATWSHMYGKLGTYTATLTVTDLLGRTSTASATITVGDELESSYPVVVYDHDIAAHAIVKLPIAKLDGGSCCARAALVDVTVTSPAKAGSIVVYRNGISPPSLAAVQFRPGQSAENSALAVPGSSGLSDFYNNSAGTVDLEVVTYAIEDKATANAPSSYTAETYTPVTPARVLSKTEVAGGRATVFRVAGVDRVPANAADVVLDITVSGGITPGHFVTRSEVAEAAPTSLTGGYWAAGQQVTSLAQVPVYGRTVLINASRGAAYFTADVVGYYTTGGTAAVFLPATPTRLAILTVAAHHADMVPVAGWVGVPPAAAGGGPGTDAALLNLTVTGGTASGTITAYAFATSPPATTSLSYQAGAITATQAIVATGENGAIDVYNGGSKPAAITVDLIGSFYTYATGS